MSAPSDIDLREGYIDFLGDMASHQRATGQEVTADKNERIAAEAFVELENKGTFEQQAAPVAETQSDLEKQFLDGDPSIKRHEPEQGPLAIDSLPYLAIKMLERAKMLLGKPEPGILGRPSWRARILAVQSYLHDPRIPAEKRGDVYGEKLQALCDESSAVFGDWRKPEERKIYL